MTRALASLAILVGLSTFFAPSTKAGGGAGGAPPWCEDNNPCTTCIKVGGTWYERKLSHVACDDENVCTTNDECRLGKCKGTPTNTGMSCDDDNPCTFGEKCLSGSCMGHQEPNGTICVTSPCFGPSSCHRGICVSDEQIDHCDDGNVCTADYCDWDTGCYSVPLGVVMDTSQMCEDGNPCTEDYCSASIGECTSLPEDSLCWDNDPCTANYCDGVTGCVADPIPGCVVECSQNSDCTFMNLSQCNGESAGAIFYGCVFGVCEPMGAGGGLCPYGCNDAGTACAPAP